MTEIKLSALRHSAFYTPYLLTFCRDYLSNEGIKADYEPATSYKHLLELITSKEAHIAQSAIGANLVGYGKNADVEKIIHFAQINSRDGFFIVARNAQDFTWTALQHKTILLDHLFQPLATFNYVMREKNIDLASLDIVDAGDVESMIAAYQSGQGDYIHLQGPQAQQLEDEGMGTIVASVGEELGPFAFSSLCCHIESFGNDLVSSFYQAYKTSLQACQADSAKSLANDIKYLFPDTGLNLLEKTIMSYQQLGTWSGAKIEETHYNKAVKVFLANGDISTDIPFTTYVRNCE